MLVYKQHLLWAKTVLLFWISFSFVISELIENLTNLVLETRTIDQLVSH